MATVWFRAFRAAAGATGFCALAWYAHIALASRSPDTLMSIAGTLASIAGTLLGFVVAALAILTAVMDRKLLINMRLTGHFQRLLRWLYASSSLFMLVLVLSLLALFLDGMWARIGVAISAAAQAYGIVALAVAGRRFYLVVVNVK